MPPDHTPSWYAFQNAGKAQTWRRHHTSGRLSSICVMMPALCPQDRLSTPSYRRGGAKCQQSLVRISKWWPLSLSGSIRFHGFVDNHGTRPGSSRIAVSSGQHDCLENPLPEDAWDSAEYRYGLERFPGARSASLLSVPFVLGRASSRYIIWGVSCLLKSRKPHHYVRPPPRYRGGM